jgi:hypothetical protein
MRAFARRSSDQGVLPPLHILADGLHKLSEVIVITQKLVESRYVHFYIIMNENVSETNHPQESGGYFFAQVLVLLKEFNALSVALRIAKIVFADEMARDVDNDLYRFEQAVAQSPFEMTI